jgi:hypothetical protein
VPFHKLSQWLAYSLVEVFEEAGVPVHGLDELTGLPEYRNGGLFLDLGVLALRDPALAEAPLPVSTKPSSSGAPSPSPCWTAWPRVSACASVAPTCPWRAFWRAAPGPPAAASPPRSAPTVVRRSASSATHRVLRSPAPMTANPPHPRLTVVSHPLVQHKLTLLRQRETSTGEFRRLAREISLLMAYEVTRDLPLQTKRIETPLEAMDAPILSGKKLCFVSILRAGDGILEGMLDLVPSARVGHVGLYRDPSALVPVEYYLKLPETCATGR